MFKRLVSTALAAAALMTVSAPALAQDPGGNAQAQSAINERSQQGRDRPQPQPRRQTRGQAAPTPEQNRAAAEALLTATSTTCPISEVQLRGQIGEGQTVYEVACGAGPTAGPGYVLISSTPPQSVDCIALFGQADVARAADPAADVGLQCLIEGNKDVMRVMRAYGTEANVGCAVDQGAAVGKSADNRLVYEVGCPGVQGFRLEKTSAGWEKTPCFELTSANIACRFTTAEELSATMKAWLASSADGAYCDVTQARYMGSNANGSFYEAKCATGDGLIAKFGPDMSIQRVYACAIAAPIGGGCTMSASPPVAPTAAAPAARP